MLHPLLLSTLDACYIMHIEPNSYFSWYQTYRPFREITELLCRSAVHLLENEKPYRLVTLGYAEE